MFTAFSNFITTLFNMFNNFALALNSVSMVARETAGAYEDESRATRAAQQVEINKQLKLANKATTA